MLKLMEVKMTCCFIQKDAEVFIKPLVVLSKISACFMLKQKSG